MLASIVIIVTFFLYSYSQKRYLKQITQELAIVSNSKTSQIISWHTDELYDIKIIASNPFLKECLINEHNLSIRISNILNQICSEHDLGKAIIADLDGNIIHTSSFDKSLLSPNLKENIEQTAKSNKSHYSKIYYSETSNNAFVDYLAPIEMPHEAGHKKYIFLAQLLINNNLLQIINTWPILDQSSGEALLYSGDQKGVFIFNKQVENGSPMFYSFDEGKKSSDVLKASINGTTGFVEGTDFRGEKVFSYISKISNSDWYLICKIDKSEAMGKIGLGLWGAVISAISLILFIGIILTILYFLREKKYYKAMLEAQKVFKTTLYSIGDAVITTSAEGMIMNMNKTAEKLTGYSESEAQGKPVNTIFRIFNEETGVAVKNPVEKVLFDRKVVDLANHTILRAKNGSEIAIANSGAPILSEDNDMLGVVLVFRDQSIERQYQNDLEESRRRLLALMSNLPGAAYRCLNDKSYTMRFVSDAITEITGYTTEEFTDPLYNFSLNDIILDEFKENVWNNIQNAVSNHKHFYLEHQIKAKDGQIKWVKGQGVGIYNSTGELLALEGFISDITEWKKFKSELLEKDSILQNLTKLAPVGIFKTDLNGNTNYVNPQWCKLAGIDQEKALNKGWINAVHPEDRAKIEEGWNKATSNTSISKAEYRFVHDNGDVVWISGLAVPETSNQGEIIGYIGTIADITTLKMAIEERNSAYKIIENAQEIANTGNWTWNTSTNNLLWSKQMYRIFKIDQSLSNLDFIELTYQRIHPEDRHFIFNNRSIITEQNEIPASFRFRIIWPDGSIRILKADFDNKISIKKNEKILAGVIQDITEQVEIEETLKSNKAQYEYLFLNNPLPMWIYQENNHHFMMANDAALNLFGLSKDELLSLSLEDIHLSEISDLIFENTIKNFAKEKNIWQYKRKDGKTIFVEIRSHYLQYNNQNACISILYDISKRLLSEKALIRSEEQYRRLFEDHSAAKIMINPVTGKIEQANQAAALFYGWDIEELKNRTIYDLEDDNPAETKMRIENARNNKENHFELKQKLANGKIRIAEMFSSNIMFGDHNYLHLIIHDVTLQKETEKKLKLLSQSVEQNPVSVVITNSDGIIEYVNPQLTKVSGYSLTEVIGKTPHMFSSGEHDKEFYKNLWNSILNGNIWQGEIRNKSKEGVLYWEKAFIAPIFDSDKKITHFVALKEDITEKKHLIEKLVDAKKKAEESERLKTAFLANMSHEIRTPLNSILGFSNFLITNDDLTSEEKAQYSDIINKNAEGLLHIINDIIDISCLETKQLKIKNSKIKINVLLSSIYTQMFHYKEDMGKNNITLTIHLQNEVDFVTDELRLEQIFNNLIINAIKFTKEGGIDFGIEKITSKGIFFFVSDTGIGIEKSKQEIIFDRFRQIDSSYNRYVGGNGLGLAIVKNLVELMHGKLSLFSELGKGSTFKLFFPKIEEITEE